VPAEDLARSQSAGQVRPENLIPILFRKVESRRPFRSASRVDKNVNLAKRLNALVEEMLQRLSVGYIRGNLKRFSAALFNLCRRRPDLVDTSRSWNHVSSSFGQPLGDRPTDAGCSADDDCYFAIQF
jgi:hypothetical protein